MKFNFDFDFFKRWKKFPIYRQLDMMDCGPTCLRMVAKYYGKALSLQYLRDRSYLSREGVSLLGISDAAEKIGLRTLAVKIPFLPDKPEDPCLIDAPLPCIAHWQQRHFVVIYKVTQTDVWVADPADGKYKLPRATFEKSWISDKDKGIVLLLETTPDFYTLEGEKPNKTSIMFFLRYLKPYSGLMVQLFIGMLLGLIFSFIAPFLSQSVVDEGLNNRNLTFIQLTLVAQIVLFFSQTFVGIVESWIMMHVSARINVSIVTDFLIKLMKLPIGFFDTKMMGDLLQRIDDHAQIESFLSSSTLSVVFSTINMLVFTVVLLIYNPMICAIFFGLSAIYLIWVLIFLKKRKELNYQHFQQASENQTTIIELMQGMQEMKLQGSERKRRWHWASVQAKMFRLGVKTMTIGQYQDIGAGFILQFKDILISYFVAKSVIEGKMTLGMMMSVQYFIGQLSGPLHSLIGFIRSAQDARISLERLGEIHLKEDEEPEDSNKIDMVPETGDLIFDNVSFRYNALSEYVLKDVTLEIPRGKITAIVGTSGSGKTTLVKLLLGFYKPTAGNIRIGGIHLDNLSNKLWRSHCGAVMQDGYVFSDTIANNIGEVDERPDRKKLLQAVKVANIQEFIESLPLGYNTMIGSRGNGISQGQRQRLLIARAVYKDPDFLFFDEATNALDTKNERVIVENLAQFFKGRTVIVVAHRLSTVKDADQIVVIDKGQIVEVGTHNELVAIHGAYYALVKNQLELGN